MFCACHLAGQTERRRKQVSCQRDSQQKRGHGVHLPRQRNQNARP